MNSPKQNRKDHGPGYYLLPSTVGTSGPSFSFGLRPPEASVRKMPGPQSYDITELTRYGRNNVPVCKLGAKLHHGSWYPRKKVESPGPGTYSPELYGSIQWNCSPSRTLLREPSQQSVASPAHNLRDQKCNVGPGSYNTSPFDAYKTRQPGFKMASTLHQ